MKLRLLELIDQAEVVDLTYELRKGMLKYVSDKAPEMAVTPARFENGKYFSGFVELQIRNHHGTHVDAPSHKLPDGKNIGDYPVRHFIRKGAVLDLTGADITGRENKEITMDDVYNHPQKVDSDIGALLLYTGFCNKMEATVNPSEEERKQVEGSFPYIGMEVAINIIERFPNLGIIGIDSFAIDKRGSNSEVHRAFMDRDILPLETLTHLGKLYSAAGTRPFALFCAPIAPSDYDAGQARAFAVVEKE